MNVGCKNPCEDIERLKVCGTCLLYHAWIDGHFVCDQVCEITDACHFAPSRWQPYWTEGET